MSEVLLEFSRDTGFDAGLLSTSTSEPYAWFDALQVLGAQGYMKDHPTELYYRDARQLTRMILNLLDLSKADEGQLVPQRSEVDQVGADADQVVDDAADLVEDHADGDAALGAAAPAAGCSASDSPISTPLTSAV